MEQTRRRGFGMEVKRRIMLGTYTLSAGYYDAYYQKAQRARTLIKEDFDRVLEGCDIVAAPVAPTIAICKSSLIKGRELYGRIALCQLRARGRSAGD